MREPLRELGLYLLLMGLTAVALLMFIGVAYLWSLM
jgi:hypothetical protein